MKKGSLLLIDDDRHVLTSMPIGCENRDTRWMWRAITRRQSLPLIKKSYDLLLVDIRLTDKDGFEVLAYSRQKKSRDSRRIAHRLRHGRDGD